MLVHDKQKSFVYKSKRVLFLKADVKGLKPRSVEVTNSVRRTYFSNHLRLMFRVLIMVKDVQNPFEQ